MSTRFNNGKVSNPNKSNLYNPCHPSHILLYFIGRFQEYHLRHQQNSTALNWSQILRAYMQAQNQFLAGITVAGWDPCLSAVKRCSKSVCSVELCGWNPTECASIVRSQESFTGTDYLVRWRWYCHEFVVVHVCMWHGVMSRSSTIKRKLLIRMNWNSTQ